MSPEPEDRSHEGVNLRSRSVRNFAWSTLGTLVSQPLALLTSVVLARILQPSDFGLISMAGVFLGVAAVLNDFGLTTALVQRPDIDEDVWSTAFWFNLAVGLGVALLVGISATSIARFYGEPELAAIVRVSCLSFIVTSFGLVPGARLARKSDFRPAAAAAVGYAITYLSVAVILALSGLGAWSIVIGALVASCVSALTLIVGERWWPRPVFRMPAVRSLASFGGVLALASVVGYAAWNIDYLVIGRLLGPEELGLYSVAFALVAFPVRKFAQSLATATFPAFARVQADLERLRSGYLDTTAYVSLVCGVALAAAAAVGPDLVTGLYGTRWAEAAGPFIVLTAFGYIMAVTTLMGLVFKALARPHIELFWTVVFFVGAAVGVLIGSRWGLVGVAAGLTIAMLAVRPLGQLHANRLVGVGAASYLRSVAPGLIGACAAGASSLAVGVGLRSLGTPSLLIAFVAGASGVLVGWAAVRYSPLGGTARDMERIAKRGLARLVTR